MTHRRFALSERTVIWLAIGSGPLLLLGGPLVTGQVLFWGTPALQFIPWWVEAWRQLQSGTFPLWNSLNGMGAPLLANYQSAFLYPPNWLLLALAAVRGAPGVAWGYTLLAMLHLMWAGIGMAALLRKSGASPLAQVVAGSAYALSGYLVARLGFFSMIWVAAWLPWIIRYVDDIAGPLLPDGIQAKHPILHLPLIGCLAMQLLAGHAQLAWYSFLLIGAWVVLGFIKSRQLKPILIALGSLVLSGWLAGLLAAAQLLPTAEYLTQSQRSAEVGYQDAMVYSFWPWRFITVFAPDFFGNPGTGNYWGYASYWEDAVYIGVLPVLLAISSLGVLIKKKLPGQPSWSNRYLAGFLWLWVGVSFLLGLGENTPVFPFLYLHVPTFALFQAPARFLIWATFGLVILAAIGIDHWRCPTGKGLYWFRLATAGAFAVTLGAGLAWIGLNNVQLTFIRATALAGLLALGAGVFTLLIPFVDRHGLRRWWSLGVYGWVLADLLVFGAAANPVTSASMFSDPPNIPLTGEQIRGQRIYLGERDEYALKFKRFLRFKDYTELENWQNLLLVELPNLNLISGTSTANNFDPLIPGRYSAWINQIEKSDPSTRKAMLEMMGVAAVERIDLSRPAGVRLDQSGDGKWYGWYGCATLVKTGNEALEKVKLTQPGNRQLVVESSPNGFSGDCGSVTTGLVELLVDRPDRLDFRVTSNERGWFYVADTWYPGWQVLIDGQPAPILRANYLFQALTVEAGSHTIVLQYRPEMFYIGGLLSILVLIGLIGYRIVEVQRKNKPISA